LFLNSTVFTLFLNIFGENRLRQGALFVPVEDLGNILVLAVFSADGVER